MYICQSLCISKMYHQIYFHTSHPCMIRQIQSMHYIYVTLNYLCLSLAHINVVAVESPNLLTIISHFLLINMYYFQVDTLKWSCSMHGNLFLIDFLGGSQSYGVIKHTKLIYYPSIMIIKLLGNRWMLIKWIPILCSISIVILKLAVIFCYWSISCTILVK